MYQDKHIDFKRVVIANIIGYEIGVRISLSIQPSHKNRGYHTSGTIGTIASAVAVAVALDCDDKQLKAVISSAATSAAGLLEIQESPSELKPYNIAHAALSGLNAAYVGMLGFCAPNDIMNGKRGMLKLLGDNQIIDELYMKKSFYEIERIYVKPYAACRHCHSAIEAAINLKNKYNIAVEEVERIYVYTYALAIEGHDHNVINGVSSAKLSIPFSVALGYVYGEAGLNEYNQNNVKDKELLSLSKKVFVVEKTEYTNAKKSKRVAEVCIQTKDNKEYSERVDYAKGDPENPMSFDELVKKFNSLMIWAGYEQEKDEYYNKIFN